MLYLIAFICPPLACLLTGRVFDTIANLGLSLIILACAGPLAYFAALFHAFYVVHETHKVQRAERMADQMVRILDRR